MNDQNAKIGPDSGVGCKRARGLSSGRFARLAWLPIPLLAAAIIVARAAGLSESSMSEPLRLVLSFAFYTLVSLGALFLIGRSFLASGKPGLLLLECGVILWSLAGTVGDVVAPTNANANATIFNTVIFLSGLCHLAGAVLSLRPRRALPAPPVWLVGASALALGALWLVAHAALAGWLPVFFIPGQGGTLVRYCVLISAIATFVLSACLMLAGQGEARAPFTAWYAPAMLSLSVGLFGIMIQLSFGSVVNWLARTAQWLGGLYLLFAAAAALRESNLPLFSPGRKPLPERYGYGVALAIVITATAVRFALSPALGMRSPFLTFYPAVILAALYGGLRAGLLTTVLSALIADYFWLEPARQFAIESPTDWLTMLFFLLACTMISFAIEAMHKARVGLLLHQDHLEELVKNRTGELEREVAERRQAENRLAAHLTALTRMHELSTRVLDTGGLEALLQEIMEAAVAIVSAEKGTLQLVEGDSLRIVAHHGHERPFLDFFAAAEDVASVCGEATRRGERVVVEDVEASPLFAGTPSLPVLRAAGVRAVQSTPLICREGKLLGILTTHWGVPYVPDEHDLWRVDLLARQAADMIEHTRAGEMLRDSEAKYRNLFQNMTEEVHFWKVVRDEDGRVKTWRLVDANPPTLRTWGKTLDEIKGKTTDEIFGPGATDHYMPIVRKIVTEGVPYSFEDYFPNLDKHFCFTSVPLGDYFITTGADITSIKKAQEALQKANDELELRVEERTEAVRRQADLIELSHEAIIVRDLENRILFWNRGAEEAYGWTKNEAEGNIIHSFLKTRFPVPFEKYMEALTREGRWEGELIHTRKDGSEVAVLSRQVLQRDERGTPIAVMEINIDITERKRAEIDLQASEERWATTLASIGDAVIATDTSGRVMFMNAAAEGLTGWTRGDASQKPITDVFHIINEQTRREVANPIATVLREGVIVGLANHTILVKKDGAEIPIDDSGAPIRDREGKIAGVVLIFRDITERKQAEEQLQREMDEHRKTEAQLRQAQKMEALGTLTGGVAHDFNNMLAAIIGFTELLEDRVPKESREARHLKRIMESSLRGRDLVKQMLAYVRKAEQEKTPLSLSSIVKETVKLIRATTPTTISIKVDAPSESGLILADPTQIQQIIMNLCTNAAHAMRENGGTLDIHVGSHSVSPSDGDPDGMKPGLYTRLTISDTGVGMSPDIMDKIFDPFFTTKKLGEGTGLGLSVVHGIVTQSNGHIAVESKPGRGSAFTLYFPQITGEIVADKAISDDELPTGSERILFVDDEEALVEMGEDILAELGYEVTSRMNGKAALTLFKADPYRFDLVITDQTMPEMTGVELAKEILAIRADTPIIMCTGFSYAVDANKAEAAGIKGFAMKPVTKREIASTIRKVLGE